MSIVHGNSCNAVVKLLACDNEQHSGAQSPETQAMVRQLGYVCIFNHYNTRLLFQGTFRL